jgi:hypothetical protein
MKRWFLAALVAAAGCSKSANDDPNACKGAQKGNARCGLDVIEVCDGSHFVATQNCASTGQVCAVSSSSVAAACVTPAQAGDACVSLSACAPGLTCSIPSGATQGTCVEECLLNSSNTCQDPSMVCASNIDGTQGLCVRPSGGLGDMCFDDVQCPYDAAQPSLCHWFRDGAVGAIQVAVGACGGLCSWAEIGQGQGSCPAGLDCLESPYRLDVQLDRNNNYISCTLDSTCFGAGGYTCIAVRSNLSVCARSYGVCGHALPLYATVPDSPTLEANYNDVCGVAYADQTDLRNFCGTTSPGATARAFCEPVFSDDLYAGLCVAPCQADADCGPGYTCQSPSVVADAVLVEVQRDAGGSGVKCGASGSGTCTGTFNCEGFPALTPTVFYCARAPTVCTPTL